MDRNTQDLQQQGVNDPSEYGRLVQEKQRLETELKRLDALQKQHAELGEKCVFRRNWTPIPPQTGHSFQRKLDTCSRANWTLGT
jgi:hypothetical protein